MIKTLIQKFDNLKKYFGKFAIVGISGIVVNQGLLTLLKESGFDTKIASIVAIEVSILTNFLLNNYWTWNQKGKSGFAKRLFQYHLVTAISGLLNWLILNILEGSYGIHYFIANLIGIGVGTVINFFLNHFWTFNVKLDESEEL